MTIFILIDSRILFSCYFIEKTSHKLSSQTFINNSIRFFLICYIIAQIINILSKNSEKSQLYVTY
ncbi:hypothetical protein E4J95_13500 [Staphylococcus aureus]|nr:hypothetical protein E4J95_13500 [Staphylococcus aureus]